MTILSKKQPGSANNPAQAPADSSSTAPTSSSITLQPIQTINEPIPVTASEESSEAKNSGLKSPIQSIQLSPVKTDSSEKPSTSQINVSQTGKVKTKRSNKRKIKSPNMPINSNFINISQSNLASILSSSSSSSSSSGSSVSSNESLPFTFSYQNDLDQTEYYRLSDDSDYELNDENNFFYSKHDRKKISMKETSSHKKNKLTKLSSSSVLGSPMNAKAKRNKNHEIKTTSENFNENNNSEDEYEQTPTILINNSHDDTFIKSAKSIEEVSLSYSLSFLFLINDPNELRNFFVFVNIMHQTKKCIINHQDFFDAL